MLATYHVGAELPDLALTLKDSDGDVIDLSSGHTFSLKVATLSSTTASFTKTTNISGAAAAPNCTVAWATSGELNSLSAGRYWAQLAVTRTSDTKVRLFEFELEMRAVIS
jgi:hypothetical protein